jgi:predicted HTH domain antitoxin
MGSVTVSLEDELVELLSNLDQPIERSVRELILLELYRRGEVSSGKAARLLGMSRLDFIRYSGSLGIPYFNMTEDEWERELANLE